ncbi:galacturonan 1,4-alpha-galacturonidase [Sarracenia purpurea var. burkii]
MSIIDSDGRIKWILLLLTLFCVGRGHGVLVVPGIGERIGGLGSGGSGAAAAGGGGGIGSLLHLRHKGSSSSSALFNVKTFGAQANGHTDDTHAFMAAWKEACGFRGRGYIKATTDLSRYGASEGWVEFGWVEGFTLTGGGTFDGQGAKAWPYNKCTINSSCKLLPTNLKFVAMNKTVVRGITSLNSKFFHIALVECKNFKGSEIKISAPANSPNTDGIHIERSSAVYFSRSFIGTGDDCISVGQGNSQVTVTSISCGPGHGISVGSLGRYPNEGDVRGLVVRDCNMSGTMNGIRIKTCPDSPGQSTATNMTFDNIVMNNVTNPIIIDQAYCPFASCASLAPSRVKLSDIYFKNIRGTSSSAVAVTLECSKGIPCQNIYLQDVHLDLLPGTGQNQNQNQSQNQNKHATAWCRNVRVKYIGTQIPPPCA